MKTILNPFTGKLQYVTEAGAAGPHTIASHSDTTATGPELDTLTDGSNADALHSHTGGSGAVDSVFTRTGDVVATQDDYTWAQVDKATSDIADITTKSHTSLSDIGTNAHSVIDTHIAATDNPHSVDVDDITPTTTKGDIIVENGTNAIRLPIGTDTQVLTADNAEASGVKWAAGGGGGCDWGAVDADLVPTIANNFSLGSVTFSWKNLHLDDWVYTSGSLGLRSPTRSRIFFNTTHSQVVSPDGSALITVNDSGMVLTGGAFTPSNDNAYNFGDAAHAWKDLYLAGVAHLTPGTVPITPVEGDLYADTDHNLYYYNGTAWDDLTAAGGAGGDFSDGGEVGGANRSLGNTDAYDLSLETNNINRLTVEADGDVSLTNDLILEETTHANENGIIYKGSATFIHNFTYGYNGTITPIGHNLFVGLNAGNLSMGSAAGSTSLASYNTIIGESSFVANTNGHHNSTNGYATLYNNTTGYANVAIGYYALHDNMDGHNNVAVGIDALQNNTSGYYNAVVGSQALNTNTSGAYSVAFGYRALHNNTTGNYNLAAGSEALRNNTSGGYNVALGYHALHDNTTATNNIAIGALALFNNMTGNSNTALGAMALYNASGASNTAFGHHAGRYWTGDNNLTASNNSIFIGASTKALANSTTNEIVIGYAATGNGANTAHIGNMNITQTTLEGKVLSSANNTDDLGDATHAWKDIHMSGNINANTSFAVHDGTRNRININTEDTYLYSADGSSYLAARDNNIVQVGNAILRSNCDNAYSCGTSAQRWTAIYATNGTIQTSDERLKKDIKDLPPALVKAVSKLQPREFTWKKNANGKHIGFVAQEVNAVFEGAGIDPKEYFVVQSDEYYALVYTEFIALITAYAQSLETRLEAIEKHLGL